MELKTLFTNISSDKHVSNLKRLIMRDGSLSGRLKKIRNNMRTADDKTGTMPSNPEILRLYKDFLDEGIIEKNSETEHFLKRLKVRSNSGVAVISLLTKPYACPGRCIYCPTEKNMPKSYLSKEPAAARALAHRFDPYNQITARLRALEMNGHPVDKVEMIMIGGTWTFYPKDYREHFTRESFRACNNWKAKPENFIPADHKYTLRELQDINEKSVARIIGLSIETRPDHLTIEELDHMRYLGVTKVEIGVQHLDNYVLEYNKREMTAESIAESAELLRTAGFKVVYHMMPNLPKSNPELDVKAFKDLYNDKYHHPDMMKMYPCMILRGSVLYKQFTRGEIDWYKPYDDKTLTEVLADCEREVKPYTRIIRIIRDIPATYIIGGGSKKSNLREVVDKFQADRGVKQTDIRAREVRDSEIDPKDFEMTEIVYETVHGKEYFIQFENKAKNQIAGFVRLRLQDKSLNEEFVKYENLRVLVDSAIIRELHVYGTLKRVGEEGTQSQHTGMGKALISRAEEIAKENGYKKMSIISGVGVHEYYRKRGYELDGSYMVKELK